METEGRELIQEVFDAINQRWALVSAGTIEHYGSMTVAWGGVGALWVKPVITVYVKPVRNTHDYLTKNDYFTVSIFSKEYKNDLVLMGTLSGKDCDKVAKTSLTPIAIENSVAFSQASKVFVCKKLYQQSINEANVPPTIRQKYYANESAHTMFIGEVIDIVYPNGGGAVNGND